MLERAPRRARPVTFSWKKAVLKGLRGAAVAGTAAATIEAQQAIQAGKTDLKEIASAALSAGLAAAAGFLFELGRNWLKNR